MPGYEQIFSSNGNGKKTGNRLKTCATGSCVGAGKQSHRLKTCATGSCVGAGKQSHRLKTCATIAFVIAGLALSLMGCKKGSSAKNAELVIISPHFRGIQVEFGRAFTEWMKAGHADWLKARGFDGVEIKWLNLGGTSDDIKYINAEFEKKPDGIGVDLFFGGGVDPYLNLKQQGYLAAYKPPREILDPIPPQMGGMAVYDPDGFWFGAVFTGFGIIYNKNLLKELGVAQPETWEDLGNPALLGLVGVADPRHSGSVHTMYEIILQVYGWEKGWEILHRMSANSAAFLQAADQVSKDVADGEDAAGISIDFYALAQIQQAGPENAGYVIPAGTSLVNPDPMAILKGAPNRELAEFFIQFVLSDPGQKLWMAKKGVPGGPVEEGINRMCILPAVYKELGPDQRLVTMNPYEWTQGFQFDPELSSRRTQVVNDLMGALMIDTREELVKAWKSVRDRASDPELMARFAALPLDEAAVLELEKSPDWADPAKKQAMVNSWVEFAREKYSELEK